MQNEGSGSGNDYGAHVSMIKAAEESINTAFVDMTDSMDDGPQKVYDMAVVDGHPAGQGEEGRGRHADVDPRPQLGRHPDHAGPGPARAPINMANAYATLANGGQRPTLTSSSKVVDKNGETLYHHEVTDHRAIDEDIAADVVVRPAAGRAERHRAGRPGAGSAGGRQDRHRDQRQGRSVLGLVRRLHARSCRPR